MWYLSISDDGLGMIQIDDFRESFQADISFWSKTDYERHWTHAAKVLHGGTPVAFITSITDPATSNFIRSWACYPTKHELIFQEQDIVLGRSERAFQSGQASQLRFAIRVRHGRRRYRLRVEN